MSMPNKRARLLLNHLFHVNFLCSEEQLGVGEKYKARPKTSVSKSGYTLGDYDFFFEWAKEPDGEQLRNLIRKIEKVLTPLGCKYTITTK
jgi:hypothetical protein